MPLQPQMSFLRGDLLSDLLPLCGEGGLSEQQRREPCSVSSWSFPQSAGKALAPFAPGEVLFNKPASQPASLLS